MATRIKLADVRRRVNYLNDLTGHDSEAYTRDENGKFRANVGTYVLDRAYGGNKLARIVSESGGEQNVTQGYVPLRQIYYEINAYISGIEAEKEGRS